MRELGVSYPEKHEGPGVSFAGTEGVVEKKLPRQTISICRGSIDVSNLIHQ